MLIRALRDETSAGSATARVIEKIALSERTSFNTKLRDLYMDKYLDDGGKKLLFTSAECISAHLRKSVQPLHVRLSRIHLR